MTISKPAIFTVGYQGRSPEDLTRALLDHGIELVVDVRLRPMSRRRGFGRTALAISCESSGIHYEHDRALGTPADILDTFRRTGDYNWDAYVEHLDSQPELLDRAILLAASQRTCLLCFEADPLECHRRFVAERLASHLDLLKINI
jgi:uncharacterized protein (DUF488 family)